MARSRCFRVLAANHPGGVKDIPFAQKESHRWLEATHRAADLVTAGAACVTVVADREGDIYEEFAGRPAHVDR
jgi:hypothetical protein